ncbi:MAG: hypothetical protein ABI425_01195 [Patescibacteria group bacterium]
MNRAKSVLKVLSNNSGLIVLWVIVFIITTFLVGILIQNWQLKKQASLHTKVLISEVRAVIINS